MNILVFSWRDPKHPLAGGAEQVMHEHMKGWLSVGHKVTLFTSKTKGVPEEEVLDEVKIIRKGYQYWGVQLAGFLYYLRNRHEYDFVVDQFHGIPFFTPLYARKPKMAVIQEPAKEVWLRNPLPFPLNWLVGLIGYLGEPLIFLSYKRTFFITGSQSAKEELASYGISKKNVKVVPHGVIVKESSPRPKKEKVPTVMFLGILSKDKGVEDALKCFSLLDKNGKYQFWIAGKPETESYGKRIERLVLKSGIQRKVKFWGYVDDPKKFNLLARAHLLVNPSIREGWGLVNIEANAVGTPVVAYRSVGLVDSVKEGQSGLIVEENTPEKLTEVIERLMKDEAGYNKLVKGAFSWSDSFDWEKSRKLSTRIIERLSNAKK